MKAVILVGSSRNNGDMLRLATDIQKHTGFDIINLNNCKTSYYDYKNANNSDDYLPLMRHIIQQFDTVIFATPVYWYAMSGIMKVFFDRLTDLLTIEKELGHQLRGKNMAAISCSNGDNLGDSFWLPFRETARYLGMNYLGDVHCINTIANAAELKLFYTKISSAYQKNQLT